LIRWVARLAALAVVVGVAVLAWIVAMVLAVATVQILVLSVEVMRFRLSAVRFPPQANLVNH